MIGIKILWLCKTTSISIIRKKNKRISNGEDNYSLTNVDQLLPFTQSNMQRVNNVKELVNPRCISNCVREVVFSESVQ